MNWIEACRGAKSRIDSMNERIRARRLIREEMTTAPLSRQEELEEAAAILDAAQDAADDAADAASSDYLAVFAPEDGSESEEQTPDILSLS